MRRKNTYEERNSSGSEFRLETETLRCTRTQRAGETLRPGDKEDLENHCSFSDSDSLGGSGLYA